jgi:hypothetical protein
MARFNEILVGRYNRLVQKLFSMKGGASLVTIADEMMPVLPFFHGVENRYLEGWDRFGFNVSVAGTVGNNSGVRIRNPSASNVIVVFEKLNVVPLTAADQPLLQIIGSAADLGTLVASANSRLDTRGRNQFSLSFSKASPAANPGVFIDQLGVAIGTDGEFIISIQQELPLLPGDAYQISSNVLNQGLQVSARWRERFLEESERT